VPGNLVIVAPAGSHYSIVRAAGILGLGADAVKAAPVDANGRFEPAKLEEFIDRLRNEGSQIMAVVANACATATGLYDPLRAIGKVCGDLAVWLHIDGAHGASALVSERHRHLLDGVEQADSLVWDAHKMLRTPTLCAAVLTRNRRDLDGAFQEEASYLFHEKDQPGFDFIHRTVECTKAALGLKVFCALAGDGERGIAAYVDRQTELARSAAAFLRDEPQIEVAVEPQSNIVCFRIDAEDEVQLEIRRRLTDTGTFYISTAEFRSKRWLRLALMNPATELSDIRKLVSEVRAIHANAKSERIAFPSVSHRP
jgi:L-2,4-diaminobutyrate decarboxylase